MNLSGSRAATRGLLVGALLLLGGCGANVAGVQMMPAPQTPDQGLFEAETAYDLALKQAESVPMCSASVTTACLSGQQMGQLYIYATQGVAALNAAKAAVAAYDAAPTATGQQKAVAAVSALGTLTEQIGAMMPKKGA